MFLKPRQMLREMERIIAEFVFFLLDFQETGKTTILKRVDIFFLKVRYYFLVFCLRRSVLSEQERYIQIRGEFQSAAECMNIVCSKRSLIHDAKI